VPAGGKESIALKHASDILRWASYRDELGMVRWANVSASGVA